MVLPRWALMLGMLVLAGCAAPVPPAGTHDPYEVTNRAWFETNLALAGGGERDGTEGVRPQPNPLRRAAINVGANLGLPSDILNDLLQIRPDRAVENTVRLVVNTTVGLGGLFDPAGAMGVHGRNTDFGETLHRWGVGEGAYMVLPLIGPTTERDTLGMVVDVAINPLRFALTERESAWALALRGAARLASAAENSDVLDANVINTSDPYAQARLLYLQTRRYHLGIENDEEFIDPYADN